MNLLSNMSQTQDERLLLNQFNASRAGVPQTPFSILRFDVETRSLVDLKKVGAWVYSLHPSTELLVMKYAVDRGPMLSFVPDMFNQCQAPELWCRLVSSPTVLFEAWNAFFEWCMYVNHLVRLHGWPYISPERWRCSMATSCYLALPRALDEAGSALGLPIQKDKEGHRVMLKLAKPRKPSKNNPARYHSKPEDFVRLAEYCGVDVESHRAIADTIGVLPPDELVIWQIDQLINRRGVHCDVEAVEGAIHILDLVMGQYQDQIRELTGGAIQTTNQAAKIVEWCGTHGVHLDNLQADTIEDVLTNGVMVPVLDPFSEYQYEHKPLPDIVHRVLTTRKSAAKSSVKKYASMLARVDLSDNRIRAILLYHGASTGRWSGSGIQIQNYPRGTFKFRSKKNPDAPALETAIELVKYKDYDGLRQLGDIPAILSTLLRSMLCAAPGMKLIAADYSAVEARVSLWLVGDEDGLQVFRVGGDIYKDTAAPIFNTTPGEVDDQQRWVGKQCWLGLGYQMGWKRFQSQCASNGVTISDELAKSTVNTFRAKYSKVKDNWDAVNDAALYAFQSGQPARCGKVTFFMSGDFLKCRLPSGRDISYYKPHHVPSRFNPNELSLAYMGMDSQKHKWTSIGMYGGKWVENIVQGIAGCLLRVATVALEVNNYPIVLSVHDELVAETPDRPEFNVDTMSKLMCTMPAWAAGLPLTAEGWEGQRFKK